MNPSSTWRFFTEEERALARSVDQQRANDLSVHLYNVHALKARLRDPDTANVEHYHDKKRWIKPDEDGNRPWQPPDKWTAWPLPPDQVPRSGEKFGVSVIPDGLEGATYRKAESWRPNVELREEVLAIALGKAKERLRAHGEHNGLVVGEADADTPPTSDAQMSSALPADADVPMADDGDIFVDFVSDKHRETTTAKPSAAPALDENILLDDDEARALLQPKINHILSQLDGLLTGMHKSRKGQVRTNSRSRSNSGQSRSTSRPASSSTRLKSRRRKVQDENEQSYVNVNDAGEDDESNVDQPKRRRKLNPRDWSEVLGIAAFTGWDSKVVSRAAQRCSALFGEDMDFQTISLNSIKSTKSKTRATAVTVNHQEKAAPSGGDFIIDDTPKKSSHVCPIETCARHNVPFDKAWRWREHLKRSHKYSNARVQKLEAKSTKDAKPPAVNKAAGGNRNVSRTTADPLLRPVNVKMVRGKDKQPRKRKASLSEPIPIEEDEHADAGRTEQPIMIDSGSNSDDEDTGMDEVG